MRITVLPENEGVRLDTLISQVGEMSRSSAARLIAEGAVTVNGTPKSKNYSAAVGDEIEVETPDVKEVSVEAQNIPIDIVYEDGDIAVINKESGMVVHPANGNPDGTLVNALLYHCKDSLSGINGELRPGIVHRIDKDTSGLLVIAKNDEAHRALAAQLEGHHITREYHALVNGGFRDDSGTVNLPIGRCPRDRKKMAVVSGGREAITHYEVLERFGKITYIKLNLETGRTHQIRVHMSHNGHPLLGDTVYGGSNTKFEREHSHLLNGQCLHAKRLSFTHPRSGEPVSFECPLPDNFSKLLEILRNENN